MLIGEKSLVLFASVAGVWVIEYLAMFPGVYGYDGPFWWLEFSKPNIPISSQWSPVYAGLFAYFTNMGMQLWGRYEYGFAVFTALQLLLNLGVIYQILSYINKCFGKKAAVLTALFYCVTPATVIIAVSTAQAACYMPCMAMCMLSLVQMSREPDQFFQSRWNIAKFLLWSIMSCIFRNNGMYAILFGSMFLLLAGKKLGQRLIGLNSIVIIVVIIYNTCILPAVGVVKVPALKEMLSIPLQQMAYVYCYEPEKLSEGQRLQLEEYVPQSYLLDYREHACIADTRKNYLNQDLVKQSFSDFLKLYCQIGIKSPGGYANAFYLMNLGFLYPWKKYPDSRMWHPYIEYGELDAKVYNSEYIDIERLSFIPPMDRFLGFMFGSYHGMGRDVPTAFSDIPGLALLSKGATYTWILLFVLFISAAQKRAAAFAPLSLLLGYGITIMLAPVILYRYCAPLVLSAPLMISILHFPKANETGKANGGKK